MVRPTNAFSSPPVPIDNAIKHYAAEGKKIEPRSATPTG
jgi:hypothetical protein